MAKINIEDLSLDRIDYFEKYKQYYDLNNETDRYTLNAMMSQPKKYTVVELTDEEELGTLKEFMIYKLR